MRNVQAKYPREFIAVAGDFNQPRQEVERIAALHNLRVARPASLMGWYTRRAESRLARNSELDYFLSNKE